MKKVLNFLGNVLIVAVLVVAIVMTVAIITSTRGEKARIPNLFGYALLSVQSDSMESEKGMFVGDIIIDKLLTEDEANDLHVGDVITFIRLGTDGNEFLETHRIVEHVHDREIPAPENEIIDGIWTRGGDKYYTTRGDNTPDVDLDAATQRIAYVYKGSIVGVWTGIRIPKLGTIMDFLQTSMGFMICIVIPVALFFIYQLYVFIITLTRRQKEKALEEVSSKEEELKQKAIAEFLAQQQANAGQTALPETKPAEPEPDNGKKKRKSKKVKEESQEEAETEAAEEAEKEETPGDGPETIEADASTGDDEPAQTEEKKEEAGSEEDASNGEDGSETDEAEETEEKAESEEDASNGEDKSEADEAEETEEEPEEKVEAEETDASNGEDESAQTEEAETEEETDTDADPDEKTEQEAKPDAETADPAHTPEISEEEKERIIREYLAKQAQEPKPEE